MEYLVFTGIVIGCIFIIFIIGMFQNAKEHKKFKEKLKVNFGQGAKRKWKEEDLNTCRAHFEKNKKDYFVDDITWNDLNLELLYQKMNDCQSSAGDEYLYYLLRTPVHEKEILKKRESDISYFMEHEKERIDLQFALHMLGRTGKYSIYRYMDNLEILGNRNNTKKWLFNSLYLVGIVFTFIKAPLGIMMLVAVMAMNIVSYFKEKAEIEPYLISFAYILRLLDMSDNIQSKLGNCHKKEKETLKSSSSGFKKFRRGAFLLNSNLGGMGTGNPLGMLLDYGRMCFHIDIMKFNQMLYQLKFHTKEVCQLLETIGYLDSMISIGCYRKSFEGKYCLPTLTNEKGTFCGVELFHPLIENPITNDAKIEKSILITGSNASGKSTFLKTIALNSIFAQTIHTCFAKELRLSFCHVMSSMSLKDSIESGESYYIVEIKSMKRMLEMAQEAKLPVFCFVDEVLRGTNTVERIAAATAILQSMNDENTLCFAATHDIELTHLLEDTFVNYHFEEEMRDNDIFFSYKLLDGSAKTRNAIKLLQVMGYQKELILEAEQLALKFLTTGVWERA